MTVYLDTSVLVAYYCPEPMSEAVEKVLLKASQPVVSALTEVEFVSALSRKVREKALSRSDAHRLLSAFELHLSQLLLRRVAVERDHYALAYTWMSQFATPLRTLDALHLAVAAKSGLQIITSDRQLSASAEKIGVRFRLLQ